MGVNKDNKDRLIGMIQLLNKRPIAIKNWAASLVFAQSR